MADSPELMKKIERLKAKNVSLTEDFQARLTHVESECASAKEECEDLRDEMASQRTRQEMQVESLSAELKEANDSGHRVHDLTAENMRLQLQLAQERGAIAERDVLKESMKSMASNYEEQVRVLSSLVQSAETQNEQKGTDMSESVAVAEKDAKEESDKCEALRARSRSAEDYPSGGSLLQSRFTSQSSCNSDNACESQDGGDRGAALTLQAATEQLEALRAELSAERAANALFKEEATCKDAQNTSKLKRLQAVADMADHFKEGKAQAEKELDQERHNNEQRQKEVTQQLQQMETELEGLRQQLLREKEARGTAEARTEELTKEVRCIGQKHVSIVGDLKKQLASANGPPGSARGLAEKTSERELESLRHQLQRLTEDKKSMLSSFEAKELQLKGQLEERDQQHAVEVAELKLTYKMKTKEFEARIKELEKQAGQASCSAKENNMEQKLISNHQERTSGIMDILRCPSRFYSRADLREEPKNAQEICWRVLASVKDIAALLCTLGNYEILEASKTACKIWGSSALQGRSILELVNGKNTASWLRKAFETHQRFAETHAEEPSSTGLQVNSRSCGIHGFVVRDLGCEEFVNKGGHVFDSTVLTAHLPAEPSCGKRAALLVIVEPCGDISDLPKYKKTSETGRNSNSKKESRAPATPKRRGTPSEVSSSSINPSDSASNIKAW